MKPAFENIYAGNSSFLVRKFEEIAFEAPYHLHPELELTLILKGTGKRYVGSNMNDFFAGDLVLLGSNLPHCWKSDAVAPGDTCSSVVIQFRADFMGKDFFLRPETEPVHRLLNSSNYGLHFTGEMASCKNNMRQLVQEGDGFKRLQLLLEIFRELTGTDQYTLLNNKSTYPDLPPTEKNRLNAVMAYIVENFQEKVTLQQAAATANMTPHAFCRYFKRMSRKTFIGAVNDYRIHYAIRELVQSDKPVEQIGFESGFNDISNFYKTFKERLKVSPLSYRNNFLKKLQG